jgi:hypothetical protein
MNRQGLISVRKLAALDIVFHGSRLILLEFAGIFILCVGLGLLFLYRAIEPGPGQFLLIAVLGFALFGIGLNYLPLLFYSIQIVRHKSAQLDVVEELAHPEKYQKAYGWQSIILILIPFALLILAGFQKGRRE